MTDFSHLPPQYREHAAEFQGEELDRSLRQEKAGDRIKEALIQSLEESIIEHEREEHIPAD